MKYVRLKDGRIMTNKTWQELADYALSKCCLIDDMILAQDDAIEELLDGFILVDKKNPKNWFTADVEEVMNTPKDELLRMMNDWEYHGYVQTKKGMQYVTDFDEKGELFLLIG